MSSVMIEPRSTVSSCKGSIRFLDCPPNTDGQLRFYNGARSSLRSGTLSSNPLYVEKVLTLHNLRHGHLLSDFDRDGLHFMRYQGTNAITPEIIDVVMKYLVDVTQLVKEFFGAEDVICYDYKFRSSDLDEKQRPEYLGAIQSRAAYDLPSDIAHVDITSDGALNRLRRHLTKEEQDHYLANLDQWRLRIVNVWRPLEIVRDRPLAFCLPDSVEKYDLVPIEYHTAEDYAGEIYNLRYNASQKWVFLADQTPGEIALFLGYDSRSGTSVQCCPHSSFAIPIEQGNKDRRRSIEARIMVISKC